LNECVGIVFLREERHVTPSFVYQQHFETRAADARMNAGKTDLEECHEAKPLLKASRSLSTAIILPFDRGW
jgi:hypothetical protein